MTLTIFTPTYNRAYILPKLFESLQNQELYNFEWLIVDDGSTDNTKELVEGFKSSAPFPIHYVFQENQGKHVAINTALDYIKTMYFVTVDSDDLILDEMIKIIAKYRDQLNEDKEIIALSLPIKIINSGKPQITKKIDCLLVSTPSELRYHYGISGEFSRIFKTEIARKYKYPVFENEKFMQESVVYNKINQDYKFLYAPESIVEAEYLEDGLTANLRKLLIENPKGAATSYLEKLKIKEIPLPDKKSILFAFWDYESLHNPSFFSKISKIPSMRLKLIFLRESLKRIINNR